MSKVLVTGGSGFLGNRLVRILAQEDMPIYTYRSKLLDSCSAEGIKVDLTSRADLDRHSSQLESVTHLVHAAAVVVHNRGDILQDLHDQITVSVEGFRQLMQSLPNLKRVVYVSSGSAALADVDPTFYGLGKLLMEGTVKRVAAARDIPYVSLRFPQLFGPNEPHGIFVTKFLEALREGREIQLMNNGSVKKDILYIDDAVGSIQQALRDRVNSGTYTITMPKATTVKEVLNTLSQATGIKPTIKHVSAPEEEAQAKSFHLPSTATALGYELRYNVQQGLEALVKDTEERKYV